MKELTCVVLCHNEAINIRHCLESVKGWCDVFVVDSGSSDGTIEICREYTPHVFSHEYSSHAAQWDWSLQNLPLLTPWVLALDADFVVTDSLKVEIEAKLPTIADDVAGIYVRHRYVFGGGDIRFGGTKQNWLRIIRRGRATPDLSDLVDFRFNVDGKTTTFAGAVTEYNRHDDDISVWVKKQDKFSLRLAVEEELRRHRAIDWAGRPNLFGNADEKFMWLRDAWRQLPLFLRPCVYFVYRYFLMFGWLDGRAGFLYAALQGFWLRLVVDWKIWQLRQAKLGREELEQLKDLMFTTRDGSVAALLSQLKINSTVSENRS
jgi:glycosyltransferase involved in cell wall biosynthesis